MAREISLAAGERGVVRVFALSLSEAEAEALREAGVGHLFGGVAVDAGGLEIFPVSDLEDVGLWGLLQDGHGVAQDQLEQDRAKLAALDGWVIVATSQAFPAGPANVTLAPEITLIGTYWEPKVDWTDTVTLQSAAATEAAPAKKRPSDAAMSGRIAMLALLVLFALTAVVVWVSG